MTSKIYNAYIVFFTVILHNYNVNGSICESVCTCRISEESDNFPVEYIDCSYKPLILKSDYILPKTVYSLDLSMNNISVVEESSLLRSESMVELFLNENSIKELNNVFVLPELKLLDLSDNVLEFIHEATFKGVPKLEYLNLSNNMFQSFDKLTFNHLVELKEIILDNNNVGPSLRKINIFDQNGFGLTHKIESVSIRKINLNFVPDNFFAEAYNLRKLVISNNNLKEIFELPFTLEYLDLSDNPIRSISIEDFSDVPALKELKLNRLQVKEIPDYVFSPLQALTDLELDRNKNLTIFSPLAFGERVLDDGDEFALRRLSIRSCRLRTLDEQLMEPFAQLARLDLQGNPWICDCHLLWLKQLQIPSIDRADLRCATPKPLHNSKIFDLDDKYFVCVIRHHLLGLTIAVVVGSFCLAGIAIWLFLCHPRARCKCLLNMHHDSSAMYTVLPLSASPPFEARI